MYILCLFSKFRFPVLNFPSMNKVTPLQPGASARTLLPMVFSQNVSPGAPNSVLQVAVKNNQQPVWYFSDKGSLHVFFGEDGKMERTSFLEVRSKSSCFCCTS